MSVKIYVADTYNDPVKRARVNVKWKNGQMSAAQTNDEGVADLNCTGGIIIEIKVWDKEVLGHERKVGDDSTVSVQYK